MFSRWNLVDWQQVGHIPQRESQLNVRRGIEGASGGIYAPTIRFRDTQSTAPTTAQEKPSD